MDIAGWVLLIGTGLWVIMLFAVEAYTAMNGLPTISDRIRSIGGQASIVVIISSFVIGYLLSHFWDSFSKKKDS